MLWGYKKGSKQEKPENTAPGLLRQLESGTTSAHDMSSGVAGVHGVCGKFFMGRVLITCNAQVPHQNLQYGGCQRFATAH